MYFFIDVKLKTLLFVSLQLITHASWHGTPNPTTGQRNVTVDAEYNKTITHPERENSDQHSGIPDPRTSGQRNRIAYTLYSSMLL